MSRRTRPAGIACGFFSVLIPLWAAGCGTPAEPARRDPVDVRIGIPEADVSAADIGLRQIAALLTREGLINQTQDGRVSAQLAERWTASGDGLVWRFVLQNGITFHDGTRGGASEIVESLRAAMPRGAFRGLRPGLADIASVEVADSRTIEIRLRRRSTFLLEDLEVPLGRAAADKTTVGTGPFKTVSQSESQIVLHAHDQYHQGRPKLDRVRLIAYPALRTAWTSLMRREIDVLWDLSRDLVEFAKSSDVGLYSYLRHYVYVIGFNAARPYFAPVAVRRALNAAVERKALIGDVLRGQGEEASGPIWPQHWAYDSSLRGYAYDPSLASTTLDAAGLKLITRPDGRRARFAFTCILAANRPLWERMALNVQKQLYDIGVDMQLQVLSADEFNRRLRAGEFDAAMIELLSGPSLSRPYVFWRWGGEPTAYNVFGYRSATTDRWFDAVRSAPSDAEYRVAAGQLQRALLDDPPALFLAWSQGTRAVTRRFKVLAEPGRDPIRTFWRWTVNETDSTTH